VNQPVCYIAGPMRGIAGGNFPAFDRAAARLTERGYKVINPAQMDRDIDGKDAAKNDEEATRRSKVYARRDTKVIIDECTHIYMLRGWGASDGACAEHALARWIGLKIMFEDDRAARELGGWSMSGDQESEDMVRPSAHTCGTTVVKDSGKRATFASGMQRDTNARKLRFDLAKDGPMFMRWVRLLTAGAMKYLPQNWMKASSEEERQRFLESADRHMNIWYHWERYGLNLEDPDQATMDPPAEDHAAAVFFNINGHEYVKDKLQCQAVTPKPLLHSVRLATTPRR
jgi:hypothetical protein